MTSLIKRLEEADGPSRGIDERIAAEVLGYVVSDKPDAWIDATIPHYTASIDAALTLVPPHRSIVRHYLPKATWPFRVYLFAEAGIPNDEFWPRAMLSGDVTAGGHIGTLAKTEPIALCIAALKARGME